MDLMINSSALGTLGTAHLIESYLKEKGYLED